MPRDTISDAFREALYAEETDKVYLLLLTIEEQSLPEPIRVVLNNEEVVSRSETYAPFYFEFTGPDQKAETISSVSIRLDNVDRRLTQAVEEAKGRPMCTLEVVLADNPDYVEVGPAKYELDNASYDLSFVEGELVYEAITRRVVAKHSVTPGNYPDLF